MSQAKTKSGTFRRTQKRTPGSRPVSHFYKKSNRKASCGKCGSILKGIGYKNPNKLPKTRKRPERPFGGVLCSKCMRNKIKLTARI